MAEGIRYAEYATPWGARKTFAIRTERDGDAEVIGEVFVGDTYKIRERTAETRTVLDIGGHIGTFTCAIKSKFPDAQVLVIEPNPRNFELLQENIREYGDSVIAIQGAVSYAKGNVLTDGLGATGGGFITTQENFNAAAQGKTAADGFIYSIVGEVQTYTIEELLDAAGFDTVDLVKWDCEGGEIDAFDNMTNDAAQRLGDFVGEYHHPAGYRGFIESAYRRFPTRTFEGRPNEIGDGRPIGWFRAHAERGSVQQ